MAKNIEEKVKTPKEPIAVPKFEDYKVTASLLNVRSYPDFNAPIVGMLNEGDIVTVETDNLSKDWFKQKDSDTYLCAEFLEKVKE